ncbi:MAG: hypothetical protein CO182_01520, partial [Lysobacterales bacterium CG_4_9_14_3_um_filter_62_6]
MNRKSFATMHRSDQASPQSWLRSFLGAAQAKLIHLAAIALILQSASSASTTLGDQTTRYQYDALGQKIAQTDALNRTTRWTYDGGGRVSSRTLPDGSHEDFLWDAIGNLIAYTDFDG